MDRHAGLGLGEIGLEAFRRLVTDPRFREHPMILETPKEDADGNPMDPVNLGHSAQPCDRTVRESLPVESVVRDLSEACQAQFLARRSLECAFNPRGIQSRGSSEGFTHYATAVALVGEPAGGRGPAGAIRQPLLPSNPSQAASGRSGGGPRRHPVPDLPSRRRPAPA